MATVRVNTKFRTVIKDEDITITAPSFMFKNTGECTVMINNMPLLPGEYIGDNMVTAPNLLLQGHKIERAEQYRLAFKQNTETGYASSEVPQTIELRKTLFIIETFYNIEK